MRNELREWSSGAATLSIGAPGSGVSPGVFQGGQSPTLDSFLGLSHAPERFEQAIGARLEEETARERVAPVAALDLIAVGSDEYQEPRPAQRIAFHGRDAVWVGLERPREIWSKAVLAYLEGTLTGRTDALDELKALCTDAERPNWDGYGARAISAESVKHARALINALPPSMPFPKPSVDPEGLVSLEWYVGPSRSFLLTVGDHGELWYAGLYGEDRNRGLGHFAGSIPSAVVEGIRRVYLRQTAAGVATSARG